MKSLVKITAAVLGLLVLLIAVGIFYITSVMDPNDYKPRIEQLALEQAGVVLNIEGDISWSLYPWLGMETGSIRIAYPEKPELARLESAQVSLQLIPLFSGRVEMSDVILDGLAVSLTKDADGNVNWAVDKTDSAESIKDSPSTSGSDIQTPSGNSQQDVSLPDLDIASINIRNARIEYTDLSENSRIELSDIELTTGRVALGKTLPIDLDFNLRQFVGAETILEARNQLTAKLDLSSDFQQISLADLQIKSSISGSQVPANLPEVSATTQLKVDLSNEQINADAVQISFGPLKAAGAMQVNDFTEFNMNGAVNVAAFNLKALMSQLEQPLPRLQDDSVLTSVAFNTEIKGNLENILLSPLSVTLDDTQLNGNAGFNTSSGHITLALKGNRINADRYMPVDTSGSNTGSNSSSTSSSGSNTATTSGWSRDEVIPLETLRDLNLSITLDMEGITISERNLGQPGITLVAKDGLLNIERLTTQIYSGSVSASGNLDARSDTAKTQLKAQLNTIQIGQLLEEMADTDVFSGQFSANADISTSGQSIHSMINTLNGQASIQMKEGVLQGINMAQTLCQGIQTVTALGINPQQVDRSTPFADLSGTFRIRNGVVENNDLTAMLDAMRVRAQGQVNLPTQSIDYRLGFTITDNLFQQTCSVNNRLEGLELPINCKGQFDTPPAQMCRPDTSVFTQLLRREVQREVQRQVEERIGGSVEEQIRERIGGEDGARSLIRGLVR
ncbi:MAG: AsmA family protein [Oceanospirillales bacterium]|nr:MAG: AsmA family protein [Oceanospirillales bacterium]